MFSDGENIFGGPSKPAAYCLQPLVRSLKAMA